MEIVHLDDELSDELYDKNINHGFVRTVNQIICISGIESILDLHFTNRPAHMSRSLF